jgi:hypothetical protein
MGSPVTKVSGCGLDCQGSMPGKVRNLVFTTTWKIILGITQPLNYWNWSSFPGRKEARA